VESRGRPGYSPTSRRLIRLKFLLVNNGLRMALTLIRMKTIIQVSALILIVLSLAAGTLALAGRQFDVYIHDRYFVVGPFILFACFALLVSAGLLILKSVGR